MVKKKLFIGSSSEELKLAEKAKSLLDKDFDVTIWNEIIWDKAVFKINESFLSDLLKASLKFDFGIIIGTTDDKVEYRGKEKLQPRDNVLFELGLFTGRLGTSRCAFIIEKDIGIPSDFTGISLARFDKKDADEFNNAVLSVKDFFNSSPDNDLNFFPSSTLAAVYYQNFIIPICSYLIENNGFELEGKKYHKCKVNIIIPEQINDNVNLQFEKIKSKYKTKNVSFKYAGRPRNINIDTLIKNDIIEFIDFPTVLAGINHAISNLLPVEFLKADGDCQAILDRELRRFLTTLKMLLIKGGFDEMVEVIRESDIT